MLRSDNRKMRTHLDSTKLLRPGPVLAFVPKLLVALGLVGTYLPTLAWMLDRWTAEGSYYAHGPLIPLISAAWVWSLRAKLQQAPVESRGSGLVLVAAGLGLHGVSSLVSVHFSSGLSLVPVTAGLILYLRGRECLRVVLQPILFLFFMVPIPLMAIAHLTLNLKLFAASMGVALTTSLGMPVIQDGSVLHVGAQTLVVGDACSGLRSLIALLALGYLFVQKVPGGILPRLAVYALVVPLAVSGNVVRVVALCLLAGWLGADRIGGWVHDLTGLCIYGVTIGGLFTAVRLAERLDARRGKGASP